MVVYFFKAGALISIESAKFWPIMAILAILSRIYALFGPFYYRSIWFDDAPKLTNIRYIENN